MAIIEREMNIEFYIKETGEIIEQPDCHFFVMSNEVYCDSGFSTESQEATVTFEDFIKECPHVGFRIAT